MQLKALPFAHTARRVMHTAHSVMEQTPAYVQFNALISCPIECPVLHLRMYLV